MRYVGIDFGKKGGLVSLSPTGQILQATKMPLNGDEVDALGIMIWLHDEELLAEAEGDEVAIFGEKLHAIFGTSAGSNFTFAKGIGKAVGAIECTEIAYHECRAVDWQKYIFTTLGVPEISKMVRGKARRDTKAMAKAAADMLWPEAGLKHDGIIDAALIAEYSRRTAAKEE